MLVSMRYEKLRNESSKTWIFEIQNMYFSMGSKGNSYFEFGVVPS